MAKDDDLQSFRIGDRVRPHVRASRPPASEEPGALAEAEASVGFPHIERVLESRSVEDVAEMLRDSYTRLEALTGASDRRTKAAAKKAMAAYERVADLFEYLFETKAALQNDDR